MQLLPAWLVWQSLTCIVSMVVCFQGGQLHRNYRLFNCFPYYWCNMHAHVCMWDSVFIPWKHFVLWIAANCVTHILLILSIGCLALNSILHSCINHAWSIYKYMHHSHAHDGIINLQLKCGVLKLMMSIWLDHAFKAFKALCEPIHIFSYSFCSFPLSFLSTNIFQ